MKIKKYIAKNLKEGKARIVSDLGEEAIILSTRNTKKSSGEDVVEIVAAIDESMGTYRERPIREKLSVPKAIRPYSSESQSISNVSEIYNEIQKILEISEEIKTFLKYRHSGNLAPGLSELYKSLLDMEFPEHIALQLTGRVSQEGVKEKKEENLDLAFGFFLKGLNYLRPVNEEFKDKIFTFVGPTGSGKTLSLIKIASISKLIFKADVFIISADTYKVGGADQLQTYASVAGISFKSAYSPGELKEIITKEKERDLIFIDTTGRSHKDTKGLAEIKEYLMASGANHTFLVMSANINPQVFKEVNSRFKNFGINSLVISKTDETANFGGFLHEVVNSGLPLSYISTGQKIPEDIEPATGEFLKRLLIKQ